MFPVIVQLFQCLGDSLVMQVYIVLHRVAIHDKIFLHAVSVEGELLYSGSYILLLSQKGEDINRCELTGQVQHGNVEPYSNFLVRRSIQGQVCDQFGAKVGAGLAEHKICHYDQSYPGYD